MLSREQYSALKSDIDADFDATTRIAREKRDASMAALDGLWMSHGDPNDSPNTGDTATWTPRADNGSAPTLTITKSDSIETGSSLVNAVRDAVAKLTDPFTREQVMEWLTRHRPEINPGTRRVSVATALSRMVDDEIEVSEPGAGRRPSKYRKRSTEAA